MAETAVGFLLDQLIPLMSQEASLLRDVHSQALVIIDELQSIQCFLRDADRRAEAEGDQTRSDGVKAWVEQVRNVAFRIEDVIDEYMLHLALPPLRQRSQHGCFVGCLRKIGFSISKVKERHDIAAEFEDIRATISEIKERSSRYGFHSFCDQNKGGTNPMWYDPRKASMFLQEAEVVGIGSDRDKLLGWLFDKSSPQRTVVSVVGMGGVGKTTLAKQVYDRVIARFDCYGWITVSESYTKKELIEKLMETFHINLTPDSPTADAFIDEETKKIIKIRKFLQNKRYVLFFDDVWRLEFWSDIEHALLDNNMGGRIVITTRSLDVANFCKKSSLVHVLMLQPLPPEKAWQLFCNKAFQFQFGGCCPPELENYSRKIVQRCDGLPLGIVAIAGLLSTKEKTVAEWRKLHDNLSSELESNPHLSSISRILSLSYNDLPYYLKSCFLYFGLYPEDYLINCSTLFGQWVSEGFISPKKNKTLEEVALDYLTELVNRSLVQVSRVKFTGKPKECRIHDLLRDMVLRKMRDLHFGSHICLAENYGSSTFLQASRRLSFGRLELFPTDATQSYRVRSVLVFNLSTLAKITVNANFKLVKLLDFERSSGLVHLPENIGDLFHLKYLSAAYTKVGQLPSSIGKLQNLEILNLKGTDVQELREDQIKRLHKLRHLYISPPKNNIYWLTGGLILSSGNFGCLALQTLCNVRFDKGLKKMTQLRKLSITDLVDGAALCDCIREMKHLQSLRVTASVELNILELESLASPPEFLQSLTLHGRLDNLPEWVQKCQNLVQLKIRWSGLRKDPLEVLENLPNLEGLEMGLYSYCGRKLHFKRGKFQKLKYLCINKLYMLSSLVIEEEALSSLEELIFYWCSDLEMPYGIQHLRKIKKLSIHNFPSHFTGSMEPGGEHYHVVQHVPKIVFFR